VHTIRRRGSLEPDDLAAALRDYVVVDTRSRARWESGHIPGSIHVPVDRLRGGWYAADGHLPFAVIAESDSDADEAVRLVVQQGRDAVAITGGVPAWLACGHCLVTNPA
jgi:rhodanese-related sulfurtransferase